MAGYEFASYVAIQDCIMPVAQQKNGNTYLLTLLDQGSSKCFSGIEMSIAVISLV